MFCFLIFFLPRVDVARTITVTGKRIRVGRFSSSRRPGEALNRRAPVALPAPARDPRKRARSSLTIKSGEFLQPLCPQLCLPSPPGTRLCPLLRPFSLYHTLGKQSPLYGNRWWWTRGVGGRQREWERERDKSSRSGEIDVKTLVLALLHTGNPLLFYTFSSRSLLSVSLSSHTYTYSIHRHRSSMRFFISRRFQLQLFSPDGQNFPVISMPLLPALLTL